MNARKNNSVSYLTIFQIVTKRGLLARKLPNSGNSFGGRAFSETENAYYTDRVFDGWNPVYERLVDGWTETPVSDTVYVWGTDLSGSMQGAGGVGGLLAVNRDGTWYVPLYDANGHQESAKPKAMPPGGRDFIAAPQGRSEERYPATQRQLYVTAYVSENGSIVAEYEYDAFGATVAQSGAMADDFRHRFSTKPWIAALGAYDYGERPYSPELRRWLSRDPIEEEGGVNLYAFCNNSPMLYSDIQGEFPAIVAIPAGAFARIVIKAAIKAAVTAAIAFSTAIAIKDKCKRCRPCDPPVGTIGYRVDVVPPSKPHYPHKGTHTHLSVVMQSPPDVCKCFWHKIEIRGDVDIPLGAVPMVGTPRGGGVY